MQILQVLANGLDLGVNWMKQDMTCMNTGLFQKTVRQVVLTAILKLRRDVKSVTEVFV